MRTMIVSAGVVLAGILGPSTQADAQARAVAPWPAVKEERTGLLALAAIRADSAWALSLARVPGGTAVKGEIENEDGRLAYSLEFTVRDQAGVVEVLVDAKTGAIVSVEHESPAAEGRENDPDGSE